MANTPNTVYAHVWNLGRAPIAGIKVEFYWFNPTLAIDEAHAKPIGFARIDLEPRSSLNCHKLVKCPQPWIPSIMEGAPEGNNKGHECVIVRVSAIGDLIGQQNPWAAWVNRHVAQHNITIIPAGTLTSSTIDSLKGTVSDGNVKVISPEEIKLEDKKMIAILAGPGLDPNKIQVHRITWYRENQLLGGYTIVNPM